MVEGDALVIRDQIHEVLELAPSVPRLHKLGILLKGMEYDEGWEGGEEGIMDVDGEEDGDRPVCPFATPRVLTPDSDLSESPNAVN